MTSPWVNLPLVRRTAADFAEPASPEMATEAVKLVPPGRGLLLDNPSMVITCRIRGAARRTADGIGNCMMRDSKAGRLPRDVSEAAGGERVERLEALVTAREIALEPVRATVGRLSSSVQRIGASDCQERRRIRQMTMNAERRSAEEETN